LRIIDQLITFISSKDLNPHAFEKICGLANGYIGKQQKGKGSVGSEIIEKILEKYTDLNLVWLFTGRGPMTIKKKPEQFNQLLQEDAKKYLTTNEEIINLLKAKIAVLEASIADKDKIIAMLEATISHKK
jgi:hypothetical protein